MAQEFDGSTHEMIGDPLLGTPRPARTGPPRAGRAPVPLQQTARDRPRRPPVGSIESDFRPDIEGLRAVAVGAVLLYHARFHAFKGGYVGVDVFFVLSGFLITRLLLNEVARTGTVSLPKFWARRARRLLPASALVVVVTLLASRAMLDPLTQGFVSRSGLAASAFGANILFWTRGGYSQLTLPEPLLHFWSLAVEEQFYLFWPLILVGVTRTRAHFRRMAAAVAVVIGVASFLLCVAVTPSRQPFTFYWLPARAWELLIGAALAFGAGALARVSAPVRGVAGWLGLVGIVTCVVAFVDPQFGFPGSRAALPVVATALVVVGGFGSPAGPAHLLSARPLQWIGKHSYALYLWHYPVLVLAEAKWGPLNIGQRLGLLALSVALSAVSFAVMEDPVRRNAWLAARPVRSLRLGGTLAATGALVAVVLLGMPASLDGGGAAAAPTLVQATTPTGDTTVPGDTTATGDTTVPGDTTATGDTTVPGDTTASGTAGPYPANPDALVRLAQANAGLLQQAVKTQSVPSNLQPSLKSVYGDKPRVYDDGCILGDNSTSPGTCVYGAAGSSTTIVLFGDSHAAQWFPAFEMAAGKHGWRLVVMTKMACPSGAIVQQIAGQTKECATWRANVLERLQQLKPDLLVVTSFRYKGTTADQWRRAFDGTMSDFRPAAKRVLVLGDTPTPIGDVPSCVAAHLRNLTKCNAARRDAVRPNWLVADASVAAAHDAAFVTTGDWLCTSTMCPVVIGNVLLYRDESHLTTVGSSFLEPYIDAMLVPLVGG